MIYVITQIKFTIFNKQHVKKSSFAIY